MIKLRLFSALLLSSVFLGGCFKTRAQLQPDSDDAPPAATKPVEASSYAVDELKAEITRLTGRIEDLERANRDAHSNGAEAKKLETRIQELEKSQLDTLQVIKSLQNKQDEVRLDPAQLFYDGRAKLQAGNFDQAVKSFSAYLSSKGKKGFAEEAIFFRGEAYYGLKDYKRAIVDYSKFTDEYGKSPLTPKALLKIGLSFDAMGAPSDAKPFFQDLVEKFPKSPESREATRRLARSPAKKSR